MKRKIMLFISVMAILIMATGVVFAANVTGESEAQSKTHPLMVSLSGDYTNCTVGVNSSSYMYLLNKSTSTRYLTYQIREYKYNYGWTSNSDNGAQSVAMGTQIYFSIPRNTTIQGYYHYYATCKDNAYTPAVYDTFSYNIEQK